MKVAVLNINGQATGREIELPDSIFGIEPNKHVLYLAVKQYLANQRQGTHKSKEKREVSYSTKKIKRQKGTGGARAGSIKSPVFVGGGRVFGPRPRDYSQKLNKKVKNLARASALSQQMRENAIIVVEDFNFDTPKTKTYLGMLKNLGVSGQKTLLVLDQPKENVWLSLRNLPKTTMSTASSLNAYSVLHCKKLILSESAVNSFSAE